MKYLSLVVSNRNICNNIYHSFNTAVLISVLGVFLILSLMINVITLIVCYCKRKGKDDQSNVNLC